MISVEKCGSIVIANCICGSNVIADFTSTLLDRLAFRTFFVLHL